MNDDKIFDVLLIGGSYSGLAAAMALGRALKSVLIIDSGNPCNWQTPYSHNFLTQDGQPPNQIAALAKQQVQHYATVTFFTGLATNGIKTDYGFAIQVASGETFRASKLIFASGIQDHTPPIDGLAACWGITVLHCPYCHGYEVRNEPTGLLGNGEDGLELATLISNWTTRLTLFTNGKSMLTADQTTKLQQHAINIIEKEIERLEHTDGQLHSLVFKDTTKLPVKAIYTRSQFEQQCKIPELLGCELTNDGYIRIDAAQETTISGIYACGDNATRIRTVANAVAMGTTAGMAVSKKLIFENF
ncbi:NAD(P)/FAD-dependent oxidoreductase [Spirosoma migulaei]